MNWLRWSVDNWLLSKERLSFHSLLQMYMLKTSLTSLCNKMLLIYLTLIGRSNFVTILMSQRMTPKKMLKLIKFRRPCIMDMNTWVLLLDWSLLHWLIIVGLQSQMLSISTLVQIQQVQPEQEKLNQLKILQRPLLFNVSSIIVLIK